MRHYSYAKFGTFFLRHPVYLLSFFGINLSTIADKTSKQTREQTRKNAVQKVQWWRKTCAADKKVQC